MPMARFAAWVASHSEVFTGWFTHYGELSLSRICISIHLGDAPWDSKWRLSTWSVRLDNAFRNFSQSRRHSMRRNKSHHEMYISLEGMWPKLGNPNITPQKYYHREGRQFRTWGFVFTCVATLIAFASIHIDARTSQQPHHISQNLGACCAYDIKPTNIVPPPCTTQRSPKIYIHAPNRRLQRKIHPTFSAFNIYWV